MKYIPADKLIAEIKRQKHELELSIQSQGDYGQSCHIVAYENILSLIDSLQQEQPDNEDIDKVAQELYEHLYELKRRNNVPTNLYDKQEIIDLWKAGIEYGRNHPQQEQPDFDDVDPKHLVHSHYTKVCETKTGRVFWAEYSSEAAEWYEAVTGKAYSISDVEIVKDQPEVDLEKEIDSFLNEAGAPFFWCNDDEQKEWCNIIARHFYGLRNRALEEAARHVYESWMGGTMDDVRRDMVELGKVLNARKE